MTQVTGKGMLVKDEPLTMAIIGNDGSTLATLEIRTHSANDKNTGTFTPSTCCGTLLVSDDMKTISDNVPPYPQYLNGCSLKFDSSGTNNVTDLFIKNYDIKFYKSVRLTSTPACSVKPHTSVADEMEQLMPDNEGARVKETGSEYRERL